MTDEMLALARENARKAGAANVEFLKGEIEHVPLPDASVDVIISNCVINLSGDKRQVLREAFRVLKPGWSQRLGSMSCYAMQSRRVCRKNSHRSVYKEKYLLTARIEPGAYVTVSHEKRRWIA